MAGRSAARGLSAPELEQIREALANGRRPKVVFTPSAGQIAGQQGQVVELADPAVSDEWVVVRFGRDELPFSPTDLAIAPKGAPPRRPPKVAVSTPAAPPGPPLADAAFAAKPPVAAVPAPHEEIVVTRPATDGADKASGADNVSGADKDSDTGRASGVARPVSAGEGRDQPARPAAKAAARKAPPRVKPPAALTVTLSYADGEWLVAAQQGTKVLAKPYVIKPAEALKMVGMIDMPGVREAVEEIVAAARAEAEAEADRLRAELAEIEARLAELP
ncbi:hypothetical protein ACNTMW_06590 [Planosporangium sp. 12N6]|uniref:hypothetical protein n=1 Tax=Planosporangium spinosum TaxID=3402278 RepID=UPI003CFB127D